MTSQNICTTIFIKSPVVNLMNRFSPSLSGLLTFLWLGTSVAQDPVQVVEEVKQYLSGEAKVTIECFSPAAPGKFPAVLLLHGSGGLEMATGDLFREIARGLAQDGYLVLIPHYFEKTDHVVGKPFQPDDIPSYLDAVHDAIEFAVAGGVADPERIGIVGLSMGSYIAFYRAAREPRIKAVVSVSGALPVESKSTFPPVLVLQGSKDKSVSLSRLKDFQAKLAAKKTPFEAHVYRGAGHNFDIDTWDDASRRSAVFFNKYLKNRPAKRSKAAPKAKRSQTQESDSPC
jgi:carboxymethylenebutenolidase